jgi:hypothetical protein
MDQMDEMDGVLSAWATECAHYLTAHLKDVLEAIDPSLKSASEVAS